MANLQTVNGTAGKETLYVDVDDEITAIIDKVSAAKGKVVALVLPKRCPVLQSVVNMKLLKRTADNAGKNLVLVTSEAGLMPLAGNVGLHVASTPTSKPAIPEMAAPKDEEETADEPLKIVDGNDPAASDDFDPKKAGATSVGELEGTSKTPADDDDDTIDLGDELDETPVAAPTAPAAAKKASKPKKDKKLQVPNFDGFRKKLALGVVALIVLVAAWIFAFMILPSAAITISTDSSTIPTSLELALSTSATKLDTASNTVPATSQSQQKTATQTVPATGQQNNGQKATGNVTVTNCTSDNSEVTLPAGSTITSGGNTYVLGDGVDILFSGVHSNKPCQSSGSSSASAKITALRPGTAYNTPGNASFSSSALGGSVQISGSANGGTDQITTIVQQSDIDNATSKITSTNADSVKQQLESGLESKGLQPVSATFLAGTPQVTTSAQAGDAASNVTVTAVTTYTMLGVQKTDLQTLVKNNVDGQLDKGKQVILDDGVANAQFSENTSGSNTSATVNMSVKSQAGPQLDADNLKTQLAGMKSADVKSFITQTPGVTGVQVKYSPFWVDSVPKKASKVTIQIEKAGS
ncbi:MAG TPA: hypothetical protein VGM08_00175 [Candidatus Saccharimonadales bacterium]|jgi:hypothetical protein